MRDLERPARPALLLIGFAAALRRLELASHAVWPEEGQNFIAASQNRPLRGRIRGFLIINAPNARGIDCVRVWFRGVNRVVTTTTIIKDLPMDLAGRLQFNSSSG